jgi:hypothetical protein
MCNFNHLHFSDAGYVVQCRDCGRFQIGFGTTAISYNPIEFEALRYQLKACFEHHLHQQCYETKCISFQQLSSTATLIYSLKDLEQLIDLVEMAVLQMEISQILNKPDE